MLALSLVLSPPPPPPPLVALYMGSAVWAWVCVGVAAVGVVLFIVDLVALKRR